MKNTYTFYAFTLFAALLFGVFTLVEFKTDVSAFFFRGDTPETALLASKMQSGELSKRYLLLLEGKEDSDILGFAEELESVLSAILGVTRVWSLQASSDELEAVAMDYSNYGMQLFSLQPEKDVPLFFTQASLDNRSLRIKNILLSQQQAWMQPLLMKDPFLLISDWSSKLGGNNFVEDPKFIGVAVETSISGLDGKKQKFIYESINQNFMALNAEFDGAFSLRMTGVPVFASAVQQQVASDVKKVSIISMVLMVLVFLFIFRSVRGLVWVSFILLSSVAMASIATSLFFGYLHALTIAIGGTLIGVCIDYPIHSMVHAMAKPKLDPASAIEKIWPSLLLGGVTTVVGYLALSMTSHPGMHQLAVFASVGIGTSLLLTRFLLPHLMRGHLKQKDFSLGVRPWLAFVGKYQRFLKRGMLTFGAALMLFVLPSIEWTDDLSKLSPELSSLRSEDSEIRRKLSSIEPGRFILVEADSFEHALQQNEQVYLALSRIQDKQDLDSFHSLYPWLASEALQKENLSMFAAFQDEAHQNMWKKALEKQGLSVEKLGEPHYPPLQILTKDILEKSSHISYVQSQYVESQGKSLIMTWLGKHQTDVVKQAISNISSAKYISQKGILNHLATEYRKQTITMFAFGLSVIFLLLFVRFRNFWIAARVLMPAVLAGLVVLSTLSWLGVALGMLHLIGLLLVVSICVDYAIFIHENRAGNNPITYQAILASAMTTVAAFLSLGFASNPALQALAWTVAPGVVIGFVLGSIFVFQPKAGIEEGVDVG